MGLFRVLLSKTGVRVCVWGGGGGYRDIFNGGMFVGIICSRNEVKQGFLKISLPYRGTGVFRMGICPG